MTRSLAEIAAAVQWSADRKNLVESRKRKPGQVFVLKQAEGRYAHAGHDYALMQETRERDCRHVAFEPAPARRWIVSDGPISRIEKAEAQAQAPARRRDDGCRWVNGELLPRRYDQRLDVWVRA